MAELPEYLRRINEEKEKRTGRLNLGNCRLTDWPDELFDCYWLEHLAMSNEYVWDENREQYRHSDDFDFGENRNHFQSISPAIRQLTQLKSLYIGGDYHFFGGIKEITCLKELKLLQILNLSFNELTEIKGLEGCAQLQKLDLSKNYMTDIKGLESCTQLQELNLSRNYIITIKGLESCTQLQQLDLSNNLITEVKGLEYCTHLKILVLSSNQITEIKGLEYCTRLQMLRLFHNQVTEIKNLEYCTQLQVLSLFENQVTEIKGLEHCSQLEVLDLAGNQLTEINGLERCAQLQQLVLFNNQITEIKGLDDCIQLQELDLSRNRLAKIKELEYCVMISKLNVSQNLVIKLENIDHLSYLQELRVNDNPLQNFPQELHEEGFRGNCLQNWKAWQSALQEGSIINYQVKMMLCGNSNVGKSSIVEALKRGFCENKIDSTHGIIIDSAIKHHGDKLLYTWDMGGQEIYHGTHRLFMQSNALQVVVFDADTEAACFLKDRANEEEVVRNHPLDYWLDMIPGGNPVIVLQNKVDDESVLISEVNNRLANERRYPFLYITTRQKERNGIKKLRLAIDEEVEKLRDYGMEMPVKWVAVRDYFLSEQKKEKSSKPIIGMADFKQIAAEYGIAELTWPVLLQYLHNCGIVYHSHEFLGDHIIVHQKWALDIIYRVLKREGNFYEYMRHHKQGFCQLRYLWKEWGGTEDDSIKKLLTGFMRSCAICFPLHTRYSWENYYDPSATYVFPEFLTRARPFAVAQKLKDRSALPRYYYRYQHRYIGYKAMQQLLVEYGCRTGKELYWRNGLMVIEESSGAFIMLEYDEEQSIQMLTLTVDDKMDKALAKSILEKMNGVIGYRQKGWSFSANEENWRTVQLQEEIENIKGVPKEFPKKEDTAPLKIAISYAKEDNSDEYGFNPFRELVNNLRIYEASNQLRVFYDENIDESNWDNKIRKTFKEADLIIILNSMHYNMLQKKYIWDVEIPIIEELYKKEGLHVLRMNVSECNYRFDVLGKFYDYKSPKIPQDKQERDKYFRDFIQQQIFEKIINKNKS